MRDISLRPLRREDLPLTMAWRSNKVVYDGFYTQSRMQKPITWEEHTKWYESRNVDWRLFIVICDGRPVGVVVVSMMEHWTPEVSVYIGESTLWGQGVGKEAVRLGLEYIKECGKEYCHTTIRESNKRALGLFYSLGFAYMAKAREGEIWVTKKL